MRLKYSDSKNRDISFSSFLCKDGFILYKIIRKNDAHLFIEYYEEENYYVVTCNKSVTETEIKTFVQNNYEWVMNWYKNLDNPKPWFIFGQQIPVEVTICNEHKVIYENNKIHVYLKHKRDYLDCVKQFYKEYAKTYLSQRTNNLFEKLGTKGQLGKISWAKWYLGLCHSNKTIDYSARLIQFPKEYIDYVIYHEIAHFTHMNHKKEFWKLVETYCPEYKQLEKLALNITLSNHLW